MSQGDKITNCLLALLLGMLCVIGYLGVRTRAGIQADLARLTEHHATTQQMLRSAWMVGDREWKLGTTREDGETFAEFLARHKACVVAADRESRR